MICAPDIHMLGPFTSFKAFVGLASSIVSLGRPFLNEPLSLPTPAPLVLPAALISPEHLTPLTYYVSKHLFLVFLPI